MRKLFGPSEDSLNLDASKERKKSRTVFWGALLVTIASLDMGEVTSIRSNGRSLGDRFSQDADNSKGTQMEVLLKDILKEPPIFPLEEAASSAVLEERLKGRFSALNSSIPPELYSELDVLYREVFRLHGVEFDEFKTLKDLVFWTARELKDPYFSLDISKKEDFKPSKNHDPSVVVPEIETVPSKLEQIPFLIDNQDVFTLKKENPLALPDSIIYREKGFFQVELSSDRSAVMMTVFDFPQSLNKLRPSKFFETVYPHKDKQWVIDVQGNGGGLLYTCNSLCDLFLGEGEMFTTSQKEEYRSTQSIHDVLLEKPPLILIDEKSASASELLSRVLKERLGAIFVGEPSYGKNCAQLVKNLKLEVGYVIDIRYSTDRLDGDLNEGDSLIPDVSIPLDVRASFEMLPETKQRLIVKEAVLKAIEENGDFSKDMYQKHVRSMVSTHK